MLRSAQALATTEGAFTRCPQDKTTIRRWVAAAQRKAEDAARPANSPDTRMEAYYDAAFNLCLVALNAEGWKAKARDGHHALAIEAACHAVNAPQGLHARLDAMRILRNLKYTGDERTEKDVQAACTAYSEYTALVISWLHKQHPSLLQA